MTSISSNICFTAHLMTIPVSSHVSAGLCKIGGFECLSHSTSIASMFSIFKHGASPSIALENASKQNEAKFFVFKDSETRFVDKFYFSRYYACDPGYDLGYKIANYFTSIEKIKKYTAGIFGIFHLLFPPAAYFIYKKEEIEKGDLFQGDQIAEQFEGDSKGYWEELGKMALETEKPLPNHRIGLVGVITHISINDVLHSVVHHPKRALQGALQVALGCYLTVLGLGFIT